MGEIISVFLSSPTAVKVIGIDICIPHTERKNCNSPGENHKDHPTPQEENSQENSVFRISIHSLRTIERTVQEGTR